MISIYLNQKAVWGKVTKRDAFGMPVTVEEKEIAVRWEGKRRLVRTAQGEEVVSEVNVLTKEAVQPSDLMTYGGKTLQVIAVTVITDLDGSESHREVAL